MRRSGTCRVFFYDPSVTCHGTCLTAEQILVTPMFPSKFNDTFGIHLALEQAQKSYNEGGIPIGAALISSTVSADGTAKLEVHAASHNQRIQMNSATLHGEMATLEKAGRLKADVYRNSTMVCL